MRHAEIELIDSAQGATLQPGGQLKLAGRVRVAGQGEKFSTSLTVVSDAVNAKSRRIRIFGLIGRDYNVSPATMPVTSAYPTRDRKYTVEIQAAEGVAPFRLAKVSGLDPLFELAEPVSTEMASSHSLTLRLKRDAPTDVRPVQGAVRMTIEPSGVTLEWPFRIRVLPAIYAQPSRVSFGKVSPAALGKPREIAVQIVALPGRTFTLTGASAQYKRFHVRVKEHKAGMPWEVVVALPAGSAPGTYRDNIILELDDPDVPRLVLEAHAMVR